MAELMAQYHALPALQPQRFRERRQWIEEPQLPPPPPLHQQLDIEGAREAARQRDERWMQQMHNRWRNERMAQQQLQQDEEEEERQQWIE